MALRRNEQSVQSDCLFARQLARARRQVPWNCSAVHERLYDRQGKEESGYVAIPEVTK